MVQSATQEYVDVRSLRTQSRVQSVAAGPTDRGGMLLIEIQVYHWCRQMPCIVVCCEHHGSAVNLHSTGRVDCVAEGQYVSCPLGKYTH